MMSIKKVTLPKLAVQDELRLALSLVVRQRGKSAAKGIILFHSKWCFTVDQYNSSNALMNVFYPVLKLLVDQSISGPIN